MLCRLLFWILDKVSRVLGRPASQVTVVGVTLHCSTEPTSPLGVGQFSSFMGRPQRHSQDRRRGEHRGGWQSWGLGALLLIPIRLGSRPQMHRSQVQAATSGSAPGLPSVLIGNGSAHGRSAWHVAWDRCSAGCCVDALPGALSRASPSPEPGRIRHSGAFYGCL
ncbi:uncharacterized protein LOC111554858 [Piliocolobus tephrosceles]|uniref:uncharacterized protein LOC111554858 n=1 Tax=Piliocolobus tephrosceles TaxID=591936 RepID=UPI000E6B3FDE|nr:uncharacterized protein LOC111554858 [Piliocolobus tephrosceles]